MGSSSLPSPTSCQSWRNAWALRRSHCLTSVNSATVATGRGYYWIYSRMPRDMSPLKI